VLTYDTWPLPPALTLDRCLRELTEYLGYTLDEDGFEDVLTIRPDHVGAWVNAAARYATADYMLHLLCRPIGWMREEVAPPAGADDDIRDYAGRLHRLLDERGSLLDQREEAYRELGRACRDLHCDGLLTSPILHWREAHLIPNGFTAPAIVRVPVDATSPWQLVKVTEEDLEQLAKAALKPVEGRPVVRRSRHGFVRLDHLDNERHLLPDPDGAYWLRDFAWTTPAPAPAATPPGVDA
jgi:hypothetical protein